MTKYDDMSRGDLIEQLPSDEDFCFCDDKVSLRGVSGGSHEAGYLGVLMVRIDGEYVEYRRANQDAPVRYDNQDSFYDLVLDAISEAKEAILEHPQPNYVALKIAEESGEVVRGAVHLAEGRESAMEVRNEMC